MEANYPTLGLASVSTSDQGGRSQGGWSIKVLLGDYYLNLDGFRSERAALMEALRAIRKVAKTPVNAH